MLSNRSSGEHPFVAYRAGELCLDPDWSEWEDVFGALPIIDTEDLAYAILCYVEQGDLSPEAATNISNLRMGSIFITRSNADGGAARGIAAHNNQIFEVKQREMHLGRVKLHTSEDLLETRPSPIFLGTLQTEWDALGHPEFLPGQLLYVLSCAPRTVQSDDFLDGPLVSIPDEAVWKDLQERGRRSLTPAELSHVPVWGVLSDKYEVDPFKS